MTDPVVAIRRKADGLYYVGRRGWQAQPRFLPFPRARVVVRVDLGDDLDDYDFPTRDTLTHPKGGENG